MVGRDKHVFPLALAVVCSITGQAAVNRPVQAQSGPTIVCSYDPSTGAPNPLGMRSFITLTETGGTTEVAYEQLGSWVPGPVEAVITGQRTLIFQNTSIDRARQLLLTNDTYYRELLGFSDPEGFAPINDTLICRAEAVASRPAVRPMAAAELPDLSGNAPRGELPDLSGESSGQPVDGAPGTPATPATFYGTIAGLADGNYRYISGPVDDNVHSDQALLRRGGVLFVFRKMGERLIGSYGYIDGESICVVGRVSGNTVIGQAYPNGGGVLDLGEEFAFWGPASFLRVRRTRRRADAQFYSSAILELNDFSKINAGSSLPPSGCD